MRVFVCQLDRLIIVGMCVSSVVLTLVFVGLDNYGEHTLGHRFQRAGLFCQCFCYRPRGDPGIHEFRLDMANRRKVISVSMFLHLIFMLVYVFTGAN